jgi:hypothetical protein
MYRVVTGDGSPARLVCVHTIVAEYHGLAAFEDRDRSVVAIFFDILHGRRFEIDRADAGQLGSKPVGGRPGIGLVLPRHAARGRAAWCRLRKMPETAAR